MLKKVFFICITGISANYSLCNESILNNDCRPKWLKPKRCRPERKNHEKTWIKSRDSETSLKLSAGKLLFLIDNYNKSPLRPYYMYQLSRLLIEMDETKAALIILEAVQKLPAGTPYEAVSGLTDLGKLKREAKFLQMRGYAKMKDDDLFKVTVGQLNPSNGYENLRMAEGYMLMEKFAEAEEYLKLSHGTGHPDKKFSDELIRMYAATMARAVNNDKLALEILEPVVSRPYNLKKELQWKNAHRILKQLKKIIEKEKVQPEYKYKYYSSGLYKSVCRGFDGDITVGVFFAKRKHNKNSFKDKPYIPIFQLSRVGVVREKESHPWSATRIIAKRIQNKKRMLVDAVTGATVTSCAIIVAAEDSCSRANLTKAQFNVLSKKNKRSRGFERTSRLHFHR